MQTKTRKNIDFTSRFSYLVDTQARGKAEFSKLTGIPNTTVHEYYSGKKKDPKLSLIISVLNAFPDVNASWFVTGVGESGVNANDTVSIQKFPLKTDSEVEFQSIPLFDIEAVAGLVPLYDNLSIVKPIDFIHVPNAPKCDGSIYITGDSMYPLLKSGDIVAFKFITDLQNDIYWGEKYVLSLELGGDEFITTKFVQRSEKENHIKLVSQNKHHQDKDIPLSKVRAIALVKLSIRLETIK